MLMLISIYNIIPLPGKSEKSVMKNISLAKDLNLVSLRGVIEACERV